MGWMSFQTGTWADENNKYSARLIKCKAYFLTHLQILVWVSSGEQSQVKGNFQISKWNSLMRRPRLCQWYVNWKKSTSFNEKNILLSFHMCLRHVELKRISDGVTETILTNAMKLRLEVFGYCGLPWKSFGLALINDVGSSFNDVGS